MGQGASQTATEEVESGYGFCESEDIPQPPSLIQGSYGRILNGLGRRGLMNGEKIRDYSGNRGCSDAVNGGGYAGMQIGSDSGEESDTDSTSTFVGNVIRNLKNSENSISTRFRKLLGISTESTNGGELASYKSDSTTFTKRGLKVRKNPNVKNPISHIDSHQAHLRKLWAGYKFGQGKLQTHHSSVPPRNWSQRPSDTATSVRKMHRSLQKHMNKAHWRIRKNWNNNYSVVKLNQDNFKHGSVVIYPDRYIYTNPTTNLVETVFPPNQSTKDMMFLLTSNIIFNPGAIPPEQRQNATQEEVWKSVRYSKKDFDNNYDPSAFGLGFFAAIVVAAEDVIINLNGFELKQGPDHYLIQRFYSNIELASSPFIPNQGPHDFVSPHGIPFKAAKNIWIKNGRLGRSSHHGIHGNLNENILISNLRIRNYEVAGIHMNEVKRMVVKDVVMQGSSTNVPVVGTFSGVSFLREMVDKAVLLLEKTASNHNEFHFRGGRLMTARQIKEKLMEGFFNVWKDVVRDAKTTRHNKGMGNCVNDHLLTNHHQQFGNNDQSLYSSDNQVYGHSRNSHNINTPFLDTGFIKESTNNLKEWSLFNNPNRVVDGNAYGLAVNSRGVAIGGFPDVSPSDTSTDPDTGDPISTHSDGIFLKRVRIFNHQAFIREIPTLTHGIGMYGTSQNDPMGSVFQTQNVDGRGEKVTVDNQGRYVGNILTDAQLMVSRACRLKLSFGHEFRLSIKRNSIQEWTEKWATDGEQESLNNELLPWPTATDENNGPSKDSLGPPPTSITSTTTLPPETLKGWRIGTYSFNGDSMFHVNKGVIGFKLDGAKNIFMSKCMVKKLANGGFQGMIHNSMPFPTYVNNLNQVPINHPVVNDDQSYLNDRYSISHPDATYNGYNGAAVRGVSLASSGDVLIHRSHVRESVSKHGIFIAFDVHRKSENVLIRQNTAFSTFGGSKGCQQYGNNVSDKLKNNDLGRERE